MDKIVILSKQLKMDESLIALLEAVFPECEISISSCLEEEDGGGFQGTVEEHCKL